MVACINMDLRNASSLIIASGHHWENEMNRLKSQPWVNGICWLSSANQKAYHKHWIVFTAYEVASQCALSLNWNLYIVLNALGLSSCFCIALKQEDSDNQLSHSFWNLCKLYISGSDETLLWFIPYTVNLTRLLFHFLTSCLLRLT